MINKISISILLFTTLVFAESEKINNERWYNQEQVNKGRELFIKNCSFCHGIKAEKTIKWKKTLGDGSYPPPPLNGTAHAWHHPKSQLKRIIENGGKSYDGKMPGFNTLLNDSDTDTVIAYFQHFWNDDIYSMWLKNGGLTR